MDTSIVVGREAELESGQRFLDMLQDPEPAACLIAGEGGIGKTTVWRAIIASAAGRGMRVLSSRPAESEAAVSYAGIGDLFSEVGSAESEHLPTPQRRALEVACLRREPTEPIEDLRPVGTAIAGLLRGMASGTPIVLAVDDAGWLDGPTTRALTFALRRVHGARVGILLSQRGRPLASPPFGLEALPRERMVAIDVGPLEPSSLAGFVDRCLSIHLTRSEALRLHAVSGGNPYVASELVRTLVGAPDENRFWEDLGGLVDIARISRDRLAHLPPRTRRILAAAAALADARVEILAAAFGSDRAVRRSLAVAVAEGIVTIDAEVVRFRHPLLAAAAYSSQPVAERRSTHLRLADAVGDPEARARHLGMAELAPDEVAASAVDAGALRASSRGAPDAAADLALAALRLTPSTLDLRRQTRMGAAAGYLARAGELGRAREMYAGLAAELDAGPARAVVLRLQAEVQMRDDDFQGAVPLLTQADEEAASEPGARVGIALDLTFAHTNGLDLAAARRTSLLALEDAERTGAPSLIAVTLAVEQMTRFLLGGGVDAAAVDRALELGGSGGPFPVVLWPAFVLGLLSSWIGANLRARTLLAGVVRDAEAQGDDPSLPAALMYVTDNELILGDVAAAEAVARRAVDIALQVGSDVLLAQGLTARARVAAFRGDVAPARADAGRATALFQRVGWRSNYLTPASVLGSLAWSVGDARSAVELLGPLRDQMHAAGFIDPATMPFVGDLSESLLALGRRGEAEIVISELEARGSSLGRPWARAVAARGRALQLADRGELLAGLAQTDAALVFHAAIDRSPYEEARTYLVRGRIERRAKRRAAARATLEQALALFSDLGAARWVDRTMDELDRIPGGRGPRLLTATEADVARLTAQGLTNREVADQLFLAMKSVEGILSRVYEKLGIGSRAELGAWHVRQQDASEAPGPPPMPDEEPS